MHTNKVYDSCRSQECIRDLRVYLTQDAQELINRCPVTVRGREAELLCVRIDVEKVAFNRGFYSIDIRFFYRVIVEISGPVGNPQIADGLAVYDKRCILFGSEGGARIFSSRYVSDDMDVQMKQSSNKPLAVVEALDPILLEAKIVEPQYPCGCGCELAEIPTSLESRFHAPICTDPNTRRLFVTLGQFSIIRLERDIQLLIPSYDICLPERDCTCDSGTAEDPCEVFDRFQFPVDEFFPPRPDPRPNGCGCRSNCDPEPPGCRKLC